MTRKGVGEIADRDTNLGDTVLFSELRVQTSIVLRRDVQNVERSTAEQKRQGTKDGKGIDNGVAERIRNSAKERKEGRKEMAMCQPC